MGALLCDLHVVADGNAKVLLDDDVRSQVWRLLAGMYPTGNRIERRAEQRYPYPRLIALSPVAADGVTSLGGDLTVVGKHLSEGGLGFFHPYPISHRLAIASLESSGGRWLGFLLDIHHCRFTARGWYESGGRFLKAVPSPVRR